MTHKYRKPLNAAGGTIVLTGTSSVPYLDDQTLSYASNVYWLCENLTPNTNYRYLVFPPDGTAYSVEPRDYTVGAYVANFTTDATGRCEKTSGTAQMPWYAQLTLSTPIAGPADIVSFAGGSNRAAGAADAAYSGVWAIAVQNTANNNFEAVAYAVVLGTLNFTTYSDPAYSVKSNDFASGSTVYVSANGLNPAHFYAFGFVNTSANGMPCVGAIPTGSQNYANATCFIQGASGILPTNQQLQGSYSTPGAGANSLGSQTVQLFDTTTNDLISTQQISLNPSTLTWNPLVPYNSALGNGVNLGDTFATDGIIGSPGGAGLVTEQSVTGLNYNVSGLTNAHVYRITVSNSNGVVLSSTTTDTNPYFGAPQLFSHAVPVHGGRRRERQPAGSVPDQHDELHVVRRDTDPVRTQRVHGANLRRHGRRGARLEVVHDPLVRRHVPMDEPGGLVRQRERGRAADERHGDAPERRRHAVRQLERGCDQGDLDPQRQRERGHAQHPGAVRELRSHHPGVRVRLVGPAVEHYARLREPAHPRAERRGPVAGGKRDDSDSVHRLRRHGQLRDGLPAADADHAAARNRAEQLQCHDGEHRDEWSAGLR